MSVGVFLTNFGPVNTWGQAEKSGKRIATLLDIIEARLATDPSESTWTQTFTTTSSEYWGIGKDGRPTIIVAHGVGPLSTYQGYLNANGRISSAEFLKLERGEYGQVSVIDLWRYVKGYRYPFIEPLTEKEAVADALALTRLGKYAKGYMKALNSLNPGSKILKMGETGGLSYFTRDTEDQVYLPENGDAWANLLVVSDHTDVQSRPIVTEVRHHSTTDSVRFVGVEGGGPITDIQPVSSFE